MAKQLNTVINARPMRHLVPSLKPIVCWGPLTRGTLVRGIELQATSQTIADAMADNSIIYSMYLFLGMFRSRPTVLAQFQDQSQNLLYDFVDGNPPLIPPINAIQRGTAVDAAAAFVYDAKIPINIRVCDDCIFAAYFYPRTGVEPDGWVAADIDLPSGD